MLIVLALAGCASHIAPGPTAVAEEPEVLRHLPEDAPLHAVLSFGSNWDEPGFEGEAAVLGTAMAHSAPGLTADVQRDQIVLTASCDQNDDCAAGLAKALVAPDLSDDAVLRARTSVAGSLTQLLSSPDHLGAEACQAALFWGLPAAHPAYGRLGTIDLVSADRVRDRYRMWVGRSTVRVWAGEELYPRAKPSIDAALAQLPTQVVTRPPPLQVHPDTSSELHLRADEGGLWVGWRADLDAGVDTPVPAPPAGWERIDTPGTWPWTALHHRAPVAEDDLQDAVQQALTWAATLQDLLSDERVAVIHLHGEELGALSVSPAVTTAHEVFR